MDKKFTLEDLHMMSYDELFNATEEVTSSRINDIIDFLQAMKVKANNYDDHLDRVIGQCTLIALYEFMAMELAPRTERIVIEHNEMIKNREVH